MARSKRAVTSQGNRYERLIERVFLSNYREGATEVPFRREDIARFARELGIREIKNLGDLIYSFRYRATLPESIREKAPRGTEWIIQPAGPALYRFVLTRLAKIVPNPSLVETKIPDATPGVISLYALTDEQSLLAKIRYNRLVDIFTGVTCYSLQSHLRTTAPEIGQVETDEVYIGIDKRGAHYVFPVQVKRGNDTISVVQIGQDVAMCQAKWPILICRPIAAQSTVSGATDRITMFELQQDKNQTVGVVSEKQYRLVPPEKVSQDDLQLYRRQPDS